jgi:hypothetical protein
MVINGKTDTFIKNRKKGLHPDVPLIWSNAKR